MRLCFLVASHCQDYHREVHLAAVGNKQDSVVNVWAGLDRDGLQLFEWLQGFLLAAAPLLMHVGVGLVQILERRCFVAVGSHIEQVASGPGLAAPWSFVRILLVVKDMVVVRLGGSNLEYTYWWHCR